MSRIVEFGRRIFGQGTPKHKFSLERKDDKAHIAIELEQPEGAVVVKYSPGTDICFEGEGSKYRKFGKDEVILANEINYYGMGMSNGRTIENDYFKAMDDPSEVIPLKDVSPDN